eukprot:TRINITY_DN12622_c0_g1_i1.p1 TRINITY_DN12622_c0_g1~~TRINITY_DN12622_c0_g1_i1.p1  ORF type:complete len:340 (+),score=36.11 TRINITY_DN12622_c0_g1_i1:97-1020(+)
MVLYSGGAGVVVQSVAVPYTMHSVTQADAAESETGEQVFHPGEVATRWIQGLPPIPAQTTGFMDAARKVSCRSLLTPRILTCCFFWVVFALLYVVPVEEWLYKYAQQEVPLHNCQPARMPRPSPPAPTSFVLRSSRKRYMVATDVLGTQAEADGQELWYGRWQQHTSTRFKYWPATWAQETLPPLVEVFDGTYAIDIVRFQRCDHLNASFEIRLTDGDHKHAFAEISVDEGAPFAAVHLEGPAEDKWQEVIIRRGGDTLEPLALCWRLAPHVRQANVILPDVLDGYLVSFICGLFAELRDPLTRGST